MKELSILFSAPMVRAILNGTKTQTRRVLKPQPQHHYWERIPGYQLKMAGPVLMTSGRMGVRFSHAIPQNREWDHERYVLCPYGQPGDRLWVRETFAIEHSVELGQPLPHNDGRPAQRRPADDYECVHPEWRQAHYRATDPSPELVYEEGTAGCREAEVGVRWRPSIHMPRWASRITLEVTDVRVERLQEISEADARAEGYPSDIIQGVNYAIGAKNWFHALWEQINGPGSWDANPWVWVVEFRRITP